MLKMSASSQSLGSDSSGLEGRPCDASRLPDLRFGRFASPRHSARSGARASASPGPGEGRTRSAVGEFMVAFTTRRYLGRKALHSHLFKATRASARGVEVHGRKWAAASLRAPVVRLGARSAQRFERSSASTPRARAPSHVRACSPSGLGLLTAFTAAVLALSRVCPIAECKLRWADPSTTSLGRQCGGVPSGEHRLRLGLLR